MGRLAALLVCLSLITTLSSCSDDSKPTAPSTAPAAPDASEHQAMAAWFAEQGIVLTAVAPAAEAAAKAAANDDSILGDATGNGEVTYWDLWLLWQYLANSAFLSFLTGYYDFDMLDIDRDGDYDWDDLKYLGEYLYVSKTPNPYRIGEPLYDPSTSYDIELVFVEGHGFSASQMELFEQAARRWESIITEDVRHATFVRDPWNSSEDAGLDGWWGEDIFGPIIINDTVDDLRVFVSTAEGGDGSSGGASTLWYRKENSLPIAGVVVIYEEALTASYQRNGGLMSVMLHELGHTLGFSKSTWERKDLLGNPSRDNPGADTYSKGRLAYYAFSRAGGLPYRGRKVPVENSGVENPGEGELGQRE